ncbi:MAG: aspartyl protease family protein [Anaerolineaceae bacterium]
MGEIGLAEVRSERVQNVLVDTGSVLLCLPADVIARLGVPVDREVHVETALGAATMRLFRLVRLEIAGRHGLFDCLETPVGTLPLLGAVPMEVLGIEPDLGRRSIRLLPEEPGKSCMNVYGSSIR